MADRSTIAVQPSAQEGSWFIDSKLTPGNFLFFTSGCYDQRALTVEGV